MDPDEKKAELSRYLQTARGALVWKLAGLSEYDVRRPMVPTGTNLLGLVKHLANVEAGYFGATFARPFQGPLVDFEGGADPTDDMWASESESRADILDLYRDVCAHADATIEDLPLDAIGRVPWWPDDMAETTLHRLLVHVVAETNRHLGHADILRELIDGEVGHRAESSNMPDFGADQWASYRERLEQVARSAASPGPAG
jgi:uncharacterized damage-inducible protein DinB